MTGKNQSLPRFCSTSSFEAMPGVEEEIEKEIAQRDLL